MTAESIVLGSLRAFCYKFNIGHFLIMLPFHSLLVTFQVYISLTDRTYLYV